MNFKYFLLNNKNLNIFIKNIKKKYLKIFKKNVNKFFLLFKKKYFRIKKKNNLFKKKKLILNIINCFLLNNFIINKYFNKLILFFYNFFLKKNQVIKKIPYFYIKNINFYKIKIKIKNFIYNFKKKVFIKKKILVLENRNFFFNEKIVQKSNFLLNIKFFLLVKNNINEKIILNNIYILKKIIRKYKKKNFFNDLFQECYVEFKKIVNKFQLNKKNFFKFCYWRIKKIVIRIINLKKKTKKNQLISMEKPLFNHSLKYILSENEKIFLVSFARIALKNLIRNLISNLPKKEQKIIRLRFGIGIIKHYTLEEIGKIFNLTKERIRQIELNIILKIRNPLILNILKPYIKILKILE